MTAFPLPQAFGGALVQDINIISILRQLLPDRAMTWSEAHSVAERQATLLLQLVHATEPPVPQFVISNLPGVMVDWRPDWPTDAMSFKTDSFWRIVIRSNDVVPRQRFSLAHEFKHVLDDPVIDRMSQHLPVERRNERAERLCNYFAACFLMPRGWIKRDWCSGHQKLRELARRYYVSEEAMSTRLSELGLTPMTLALEPKWRHRSAV
jgi:predicted transcriptional regulator